MRSATRLERKTVIAIGTIDEIIRPDGEVDPRMPHFAAITGDAALSHFRGVGGRAVGSRIIHTASIAQRRLSASSEHHTAAADQAAGLGFHLGWNGDQCPAAIGWILNIDFGVNKTG